MPASLWWQGPRISAKPRLPSYQLSQKLESSVVLKAIAVCSKHTMRNPTDEGGSVYETHHLASYGGPAHGGDARRPGSGFGPSRVSGVRHGLYRFRSRDGES